MDSAVNRRTIGGEDAPVPLAGPDADFPGLDRVTVSLLLTLAGIGLVTIRLRVDGVEANATQLAFR